MSREGPQCSLGSERLIGSRPSTCHSDTALVSRAEVVAKPFSLYPPAAVFSLTFSWLGRYWVLCRGRGGGGGVQKFRGQWEGPAPLCSEHQDAPGKVSRCGA